MFDHHLKSHTEDPTMDDTITNKRTSHKIDKLKFNSHKNKNLIHSSSIKRPAKQQQKISLVYPASPCMYVPARNKSSNEHDQNDCSTGQQQQMENTNATSTETDSRDQSLLTPPSSPESINTSRAQRPTAKHHYKQSSPIISGKRTTSTYEYNNRILAAKRKADIRSVMNEFISMKKNSIHMTQHTYNLVLEAHAILRREGTPLNNMLKIYNEMIYSGIQPNAYTYVLMIRTLCKRDVEVQKTVAMLRRQSARTGQENEDIQLLESEGNLSKALAIFHYAIADGVSVQAFDVEIFNQLLRVLSHYGDTVDATFVYSQLEQPFVRAKPNSATYAALINLFGRAGDINTALYYYGIYNQVKQSLGPHDASYIYNALVDCHLKCGLLEGALHIIEHEMVQHQIKLTCIPYNSIIRHYCAHDQMEEAEALIHRLVKDHNEDPDRHPEPDASSYGPILASYCQHDHWDAATRIYEALRKTDITKAYGNLANYALLCLAHGDRKKALSIVSDDMKKANLEPDPILAERIIASFAQENELAEATEAIHLLHKSISVRTLTKGAHHLLDGALEIVLHCSSVQQVLQVMHAVQPLVTIIYNHHTTSQHSHHRSHYSLQRVDSDDNDLSSYRSMCKTLLDSYFDPSTPDAGEEEEEEEEEQQQQQKQSQKHIYSTEDYELLFHATFVLYGYQEAHPRHDSFPSSSLSEPLLRVLGNMHKDGLVLPDRLHTQILSQLQEYGDAETVFRWKSACFQQKKEDEPSVADCLTNDSTSPHPLSVNKDYLDMDQTDDEDIIIQITKEEEEEEEEEEKEEKVNGLENLASQACPATACKVKKAASPPCEKPTHSATHTAECNVAATAITNDILKAVMHGDHQKALRIFENKIICGRLIPHPELMRDVIALAGKQGDLQTALTLYNNAIYAFKDIADTATKNNAIAMSTNSILISYAQSGDMEQAKVYFDRIKAMGRFPDSHGYASMLLGSAKSASTDEATDALAIYEEAKRHNVKPTTFFYNVIISKLAKARKLDMALTLFEEMRLFKVPANSITYGAIISASVRSGSEAHSRRLFAEMLSSPSYQPRVGPFNNMMQFYVRQQPNRERVLEYFLELRRRRIKPSPHSYKLLMEAYTHIAPYDMPMAHKLLKDMVHCDKLRPQASHYATLIYSYGILQRDVQSAERVFSEMKKAAISPDEGVYQALVDTFISNGALAKAEHIYATEMASEQHHGFPYIENLFIRGYGEEGHLEKAEAIFEAMSDDKTQFHTSVIREPSTYEALIRAYLKNDQVDKAKAVLDRMVKRDFPPKVVGAVADLLADKQSIQ
ncbi:hypothetical protein BDF20DRAFT_916971 [Mycotypha africana]|uniref:uncharacterized protein n=1 Tax=Mycotypha africana TaxID=64632 RepID=UPI002301723B|nr:uncharacterized protein BDF20DRAFT_916971 [Mycotypha africana]KAI8968451.1 hypothetical protein BDF20DRAFT_916971 [Mycotypha africana]